MARALPAASAISRQTGVIVGTAVIDKCTADGGTYEWSPTDVQRLAKPRKPSRHPQPGWFRPF